MNYKVLINRREQIMEKVYNKEKVTSEERYWLLTTPVFNNKYDSPVYLSDILSLKENCLYTISIKIISSNCSYEIFPKVGVAGLKGKIITDGLLKNIDNEIVDCHETKVLVLTIDTNNPSADVQFISNDGMLKIGYSCTFYDSKMNIMKTQQSDANLSFGMKKNIISDNIVEYRCKSIFSDSFDALIFSVEWNKID